MTKLYTSRYSNKNLLETETLKIGITRGKPRFPLGYEIYANLISLAPPMAIFGIEDREIFTRKYMEYLDRLGVEKVKEILGRVGYGKEEELILLCYEDITKEPLDKNYCHRTIFAEWWEKQTGEKIEEYPDGNTYEVKHSKKEEPFDQMSLFM